MKLEGVHHVTCITGDAPRNVEFYAGVLGLRLVKKTVNQDDPTVYHLFYADERGSPGADITFFEYPGAPPGRAGDGMVHRVSFRVGSEESLDFWAGARRRRARRRLARLRRSRGARARARRRRLGRPAADGEAPEIPEEHRIRGFAGVRAYASHPERSAPLLEALGFERRAGRRAATRAAASTSTTRRPRSAACGGGTVHHVAWASLPDEHEAWRQRVIEGGGQPTPVIDRFYFRSIYFREPSGVLFEIATLGPGLHGRRAARVARRAAVAAAELRAAPRAARAGAHAAAESARARRVIVRERPPPARRGRARPLPRPRRRRVRPLPAARRARPGAAARRLLPARAAVAAAGRRALVRRAARRLPRPADVRGVVSRGRRGSTRCRTPASCSAASRRAR